MEQKEMSMEIRLLLAFVLMGLVIFGSQYFFKPPAPEPAGKAAKQETAKQEAKQDKQDGTGQPSASPSRQQATPAAADIPGQVQADEEQTVAIDTSLLHVTFSNRGGVVRSYVLKNFKDNAGRANGKPLDLVNQRALAAAIPAPFSIGFKGQIPAKDDNARIYNEALFKVTQPDPLTVQFEFSDGRHAAKKSFAFQPKSYLVKVRSEVSLNAAPQPHSLVWLGGFGDQTVVNPTSNEAALYYDTHPDCWLGFWCTSLQTKSAKDAGTTVTGQYLLAGLNDQYFVGVFLAGKRPQLEMTMFSDQLKSPEGKDEQRVGAGVGGEGSNDLTYFAGPKEPDLLRREDPVLANAVDWGKFGFIANPLFLVLNYTAGKITHNYGWAIVLVTIAINFVLFPLKITSMKSSRKMQKIQPEVNALNAKYKNLKMNDPRKQEQNQELMDLYKKHGINPVGGCLPMLLQLPFVFAFYRVLSVATEMRGASWLWVTDLSQPETIALRVLPVLLIVTQFLSQKMTPTPGADPSQQKMMMIMPLFLGYLFWFYASGLVLYWLTGNIVGIVQQLALNRLMPAPPAPPAKTAPQKKK
jgi:YidC/Oxa1 family membrane protein insertase